MFVLVLAAEADETRQAITFLIVCLVGIAVMLSLLTVWYWRFTSPGRRARSSADLGSDVAVGSDVTVSGEAVLVDPSTPAIAEAPATMEIDRLPVGPTVADTAGRPRIEVPDRSAGRRSVATRIEVGERCNGGPGTGRTRSRPDPVPAAVGADSGHRDGNGDRTTRSDGRHEADSAVLSDDDWAAVMRSAFDKMQR